MQNTKLDYVRHIQGCALFVKNNLQAKYGYNKENMMGKCIEASDTLAALLKHHGYDAKAKQVWVLYQNFESCSNYCFEEHWIVEVKVNSYKWYVDITLEQFQWAFDLMLPSVWIKDKLATFMLPRKPGKVTLDKCGWNDWYNYGDYENNFNYAL